MKSIKQWKDNSNDAENMQILSRIKKQKLLNNS